MADFLAGRLAEAGSRLAQAYQVAVADRDPRSQAWSLQNLAWVATTRGDFAGADATLGRAARLFAEQHDPVGRAWLRGTTAFARMLAGRLAEAERLARVFLPFGERVGDQWAVGDAAGGRGVRRRGTRLAGSGRPGRPPGLRRVRGHVRRLGPWVRAGRPRCDRARRGRTRTRHRPADRSTRIRRAHPPSAPDRHGAHDPGLHEPRPGRTGVGRSGRASRPRHRGAAERARTGAGRATGALRGRPARAR